MLKKLFIGILTAAVLLTSAVPALAAPEVEKVIMDKATATTDQFLVTITRPENDYESTYKSSYIICGNTEKDDVEVYLLIYNKDTNTYEPFLTTEGYSHWTIDSSYNGIFFKEVVLPNKGTNLIRIAAFRRSEPEKIQINDFNVIVLERGNFNNFIEGFKSLNFYPYGN